jgi:RNA polymerase sporulation-specific sigma factor
MGSLTSAPSASLSSGFYDGKTQMEVAAEIGISQAQVSRLEKNRHQPHQKEIFSPPEP